MKIRRIHVNGFGIWSDKTWEPLSPEINVFHGPNEAGKSTLMGFIRSILFGFDRRGSVRRYEPVNGGAHGGWLDLDAGDKRIRIERKPGRHVRGTVVLHQDDSTSGEEALETLLAGTTRTLYHNVFAFGLEELEHFHTLQETEIASHISGAGLGIGAARWASIQKDLEDRQTALFLPRGQNTTINAAFKELDSVRNDLDRTARQPEEYLAAQEMRSRLATELEEIDQAVVELSAKAAYYEKSINSRPLRERRAKINAQLNGLPAVESFPEGGVERFNLLSHQLRNLEAERLQKERELQQGRLRRIEVTSLADPEKRAQLVKVIESLRTLVPRIEAARRVYSVSLERRQAVAQERDALENALHSVQPPSQLAFLAFIGLLWCGVAALVWADYPYAGASLGIVSLGPMIWYRRRLSSSAAIEQQVQECSARLDTCFSEVQKIETEAWEIEVEIRTLTGRTEVTETDIDGRVAELEQMSKADDEIRSLDAAFARAEAELDRISRQTRETSQQIQALLSEGSASNENEFLERAAIFKQRRALSLELERIPVETPEPGFLFDIRTDENAAYEATRSELASMEARLAEARHEAGRIEERIVTMEMSEERSRALAKQEMVLARIDEAAEEWAVVTLCRALLDETRKIYEVERQPELLRQASSFFTLMTNGRYPRIIAPLDGNEIQVERTDGIRLSPQQLSRGTAEQLYLAMRVALVREYANHVHPLPVIFDDVLVNFDPERTQRCIAAIRELSTTHQVLLFTCHPHIVREVTEIVPAAKMFPLE